MDTGLYLHINRIEQYCFNLVVLVLLSVIKTALRICLVGNVEKWEDRKCWKGGKVKEKKRF